MLTLIAREDVIEWASNVMQTGDITPNQALALSALLGWLMVDCPTYGQAKPIYENGYITYEYVKGE